jgi:hypothetical protein
MTQNAVKLVELFMLFGGVVAFCLWQLHGLKKLRQARGPDERNMFDRQSNMTDSGRRNTANYRDVDQEFHRESSRRLERNPDEVRDGAVPGSFGLSKSGNYGRF